MSIIDEERNRLVRQILTDVESTTLNHEQRTAAVILALELLEVNMTTLSRVTYFSSVGREWVRARFTPEAVQLALDVRELIDELNASCGSASPVN